MNRLEKKTTATLLIAIFMISAFTMAYAVNPYEDAILKAADRIMLGQNTDGGFDWVLDTTKNDDSCLNLGISAFGVLKAYKLQPNREGLRNSLAMAYKYAVVNEAGWKLDPPVDPTKWVEDPSGVNSFPDVTFLLELAREAAQDEDLLIEIQACVLGTSVTDIADYAKKMWDDRVTHMGDTNVPNLDGSVTAMAEYLKGVRPAGLLPWDLEEAVKAALALEDYYTEPAYGIQADAIATFIFTHITGEVPAFNIFDPSTDCYTLGLTGALEAFSESSMYPGKAKEIKKLLIDYQNEDDSWQESDIDDEYGPETVQATAYAIMALLAQGDLDAEVSANLGVEWLIGAQTPTDGGWLNSLDKEYPEVDSEAAWALYNFMTPTSYTSFVYEQLPPEIPEVRISVSPSSITFPSVSAGEYSYAGPVTIDNTGDLAVEITVSVTGEGKGFYESRLEWEYGAPGYDGIDQWVPPIIESDNFQNINLRLDTTDAVPGTYEATLVFWAEEYVPIEQP